VRTLSHVFFLDPSPVRRVPIPNRYTAKAKLCFCKNNKRRIITPTLETCPVGSEAGMHQSQIVLLIFLGVFLHHDRAIGHTPCQNQVSANLAVRARQTKHRGGRHVHQAAVAAIDRSGRLAR
jgi:hypothetical protein